MQNCESHPGKCNFSSKTHASPILSQVLISGLQTNYKDGAGPWEKYKDSAGGSSGSKKVLEPLEGMRGSLVVRFAAARCQGPRFYPDQGRNLDQDFAPCAPLFHLWDHNIGYQSQSGNSPKSQPGNSPKKWVSEESTEWVRIRIRP